MKNNELHVVPTNEGWQITPPPDVDETFDTRTEAVVAAVQTAEIENLDVIVHGDDGTIVEHIEPQTAENLTQEPPELEAA